MIKIENTEVFGWKMAIAGCRNPMNSRDKSDSVYIPKHDCDEEADYKLAELCGGIAPIVKENDHKLLMSLCKGGTEESKWRRMVHVQMDITAPLYWWKEFDTYKVGTVSDSCSTMHKIHAKEFTLDDFSCERLLPAGNPKEIPIIAVGFGGNDLKLEEEFVRFSPSSMLDLTISMLNRAREMFLVTKDKKYWWQMIQLLPSSYNQKRTIDLNYEVLASQFRQRKEHKLDEWLKYCEWIKTLPYSEFITMEETV